MVAPQQGYLVTGDRSDLKQPATTNLMQPTFKKKKKHLFLGIMKPLGMNHDRIITRMRRLTQLCFYRIGERERVWWGRVKRKIWT